MSIISRSQSATYSTALPPEYLGLDYRADPQSPSFVAKKLPKSFSPP